MERYIHGSSAYKIEDYGYEEVEVERRKVEEAEKEDQNRIIRRKFVRSLCIYGLILFMLGAATVYSRVLIMQAESNVVHKEKELAQLTEQNNNKKIRIEQNVDLKKIEELAITKYGMQRPDKNQTVYVNVIQSDYGEVVKPVKNNKMVVNAAE